MNHLRNKKEKDRLILRLKKAVTSTFLALSTAIHGMTASAAGGMMTLDARDDVVGGIQKIYDFGADIVTIIGSIFCLVGFVKLALVLSGRQTEEKHQSIIAIIGGFIAAAAPQLVKWLIPR